MFDTVQVSRTFVRSPDLIEIEERGGKPLYNKKTGDITAYCFNSPKGEKKPRITLSLNNQDKWIIRAEASPGSWLFGSNLYLVNETEKDFFLDCLSEYVEEISGIRFDAHLERVTRADFTRDFDVGENNALPIIAEISKLDLPKYCRRCFGVSTVEFNNAGRQLTKRFQVYSKYHERLENGADSDELEKAKPLLRLETSLRRAGVYSMAKSYKLDSHHANHVLTKAVSDRVIEDAMKALQFEKILNGEISDYRKLFNGSNYNEAAKYLTFLFLKSKLGNDYSKFEMLGINKRTCQRYSNKCKEAGVFSIE